MDKKTEELAEGKKVTIEEIVNDLKEQGYKIKEQLSGTDAVEKIVLNNEIKMEKNTTTSLIYTIKYAEGKVKYFVEIQGKYHEIIFDNGKPKIKEEATELGTEETIIKNKIVVASEDTNVVNAVAEENNEGKISLTSGNTGGNVKVTITEENSGVKAEVKVTVKEPATSFTVTPKEATVMRESTTKLTATVEPSNATDKITWTTSDANIATVSEDGTVTGVAVGTATITGKCGDFSEDCMIIVEKKKVNLSDYSELRFGIK